MFSTAGSRRDRRSFSVSTFALMGRELGLPIRLKHSVLDPPTILQEGVNLKESIQQPRCLVSFDFFEYEKKILEKKKGNLHSFQKAPKIDLKSCSPELSKCYKRIMNQGTNSNGPFTQKQIIVGIRLRAREFFPNDKDYVECRIEELDEKFNYIVESLYHSIWFTENC